MHDRFLANAKKSLGYFAFAWMQGGAAQKCESPIEKLLLAAVTFQLTVSSWLHNRSMPSLVAHHEPYGDPALWPVVTIVPQCNIGNFRIDFVLFWQGGTVIAVECDGHDYHERTPEQAENDRSRDRALQGKNIAIIRFTGREIYRDAFECAAELIKFCVDKRLQTSEATS